MPKKLFITIFILALLTFIIIVLIVVRFSGQESSIVNTNTVAECQLDDGCTAGGCSGEICHSINEEPVFSTCIWKEEYICYPLSDCVCQNGQCQWEETEDFNKCLMDPGLYSFSQPFFED